VQGDCAAEAAERASADQAKRHGEWDHAQADGAARPPPWLVPPLQAVGIGIAKQQVTRLLIARQNAFRCEARAVPRADHTDYVVNDAALAYMRSRALPGR